MVRATGREAVRRTAHGARRTPTDVHALQAPGFSVEQSGRGESDVPVCRRGWHAERMAPRAFGQPGDRRRRTRVLRDDGCLARRPDLARMHWDVSARTCKSVEKNRRIYTSKYGVENR